MSRVRVVQFVSIFEVGGVQSVIEKLAVAQAREGFDVLVCALSGSRANYHCQDGKHLHYIWFDLRGVRYLDGLGKVVRFLRQNQVQILHAHPGTFSRLAGILAGVPVIISTLHGSWPTSNCAMRAFHRWLAEHTTILVANSNFTKGYYTALLGLNESQCVTIYNGVDLEHFGSIDRQRRLERRARFKLPSDAKVVVSAGRLHPDKGIDVLISAVAAIIRDVPNTHVLIVGDGECRQKLEQQAAIEGVGTRIQFTGALPDVRPALEAADVFVLPSVRREGFGLALVEAMAIGLPVVGANLGGIPEIVVNGVNGLLAIPGDTDSLARAIINLVKAPELAVRFSQNGRKTVRERFSAECMIKQYRTLYHSLLEKSS